MNKLTHAEAGKLGAIASAKVAAEARDKRISVYMEDPKKCKQCAQVLDYFNRQKIFCNTSCAAIYNNSKRIKTPKKLGVCPECNSSIFHRKKIYCNQGCRTKHYKNTRIQAGTFYKKDVIELQGYKCSSCSIVDWQGKPLVLELEHKDGNSDNNDIDNLCLLCPNCHSQTDTYKSKNRGNGRHLRRQRYTEGKSF